MYHYYSPLTLCQVSKALGLFSWRRTITLTASVSDRVRLDRPESSSFSFTCVFSVRTNKTVGTTGHVTVQLHRRNDSRKIKRLTQTGFARSLPLSVSFFCFLPLPLDGALSLGGAWWLAEAPESSRTWASSTGFEKFFSLQGNFRLLFRCMKKVKYNLAPLYHQYQVQSSAS